MSMYRGIFEASSFSVDESGAPVVPYFDQTLLTTYITNYLNDNLPKYVTNYEFSFNFYNRNTLEICSEMCRDVSVTLKAPINEFYTYEKTQTFSVYQRGKIWMKN